MDGIKKADGTNSPFLELQEFLSKMEAKSEATDQEKADWIDAYVNQIDNAVFSSVYAGRGSLPHPPAQMFKLAIYQIIKQHLSPSKWAREVLSDSIMQKLIGHIAPSRTSLYDFRDRIGEIIQSLNQSLLRQSIGHKILTSPIGVMDGTSVRSYGSRHRIVNLKTLTRRLKELAETISLDAQRETQGPLPRWMGRTEKGRLSQQQNYNKANGLLEKRIAENAKKKADSRHSIDKIFISLSDPEAALSRDKEKVFCPMYAAQLVTDSKSLLVIGDELSSHATDVGTIGPMIDRVETTLGLKIDKMYTDAAYTSLLDLQACRVRNVELIAPVQENSFTKANASKKPDKQISRDEFQYNPERHSFTCPAGHEMPYAERENRHSFNGTVVVERFRQSIEKCQACDLASRCLRGGTHRSVKRIIGQEIIDEQKAKMTEEVALAARVLRAQTIERTNADVKQRIGMRRFGSVTLRRARNCLSLTIFVLNLMTVRRLLIQALTPPPATT